MERTGQYDGASDLSQQSAANEISGDPTTPCTFPDSLIDEIAETIDAATEGKKRRLALYLRDMPADLASYRTANGAPHPSRIRDRLERIVAACEKLISKGSRLPGARLEQLINQAEPVVTDLLRWQYAVLIQPNHPEAAIFDGRAEKALQNALTDIPELRVAAWRASESVSKKVQHGPGGDRHSADWPFDEIILQLATLYFEVTGQKPGISTNGHTGQPSGKFVAFLGKCLEELGYPLKLQAIRSRFRRLRERYPGEWIIAGTKNIT